MFFYIDNHFPIKIEYEAYILSIKSTFQILLYFLKDDIVDIVVNTRFFNVQNRS